MRALLTLVPIAILGGCATIDPLPPAASQVQQIGMNEAKACQFIQVVQYSSHVTAIGKNETIVRTIGENGLRNAVAAAGGNAFVLTNGSNDWFMGDVSYTGSAYRCGH